MIEFSYPGAAQFMRRRKLGLFLRRLRLRPPEKLNHALHTKIIAELQIAIRDNVTDRQFDYGGDVRKSYLSYADGRIATTEDHTFYPRLFYTAIPDTITADHSIRTVLNFGAFFANVDATLALVNPSVKFIAIDYDRAIQELNESMFAGKNIKFITAQIEDAVSDINYERPGLLAHCKTATLMYPAKIERLYQLAAENGVKYIVGVENTGFCWELGDFYKFSTMPRRSAFHKSTMFVHNYPGLLKQAGYDVTHGCVEYDGNNNAVTFVAKLSGS